MFFLLRSFLNCYSYGYGHSYHGVVTCADVTHHFYVGGNGGGACELCVGVHTTHGVGHTVGSGTCSHVIGVKSSTGTTTGCNGEVLNAVLVTPLLIPRGRGVIDFERFAG